MNRAQTFLIICLLALAGVQRLEVMAVRDDQAKMKAVYDGFLGKRIKGKRMGDFVKPDTVALFPSNQGYVACAVIKGDK